jgi:aspartate aminotransferase
LTPSGRVLPRYTAVSGFDELREAVVAEFRTNYGLACEPVEVVVSYGAKHSLYNLNSPSNPTGSVWAREELEALAPPILRHGLVVISDDIYYRMLFDNHPWTNWARSALS